MNSVKENSDERGYAEYRRRRVRRLKKIIVGVIITAIVVPLICAIVFAGLFIHTRSQLQDIQAQYNDLLAVMEQLKDDYPDNQEEQEVFSTSEIKDSERNTTETEVSEDENLDDTDLRKVYLTFDDGPSPNTGEILDILDKYGVKATFFVVGKTDEESAMYYKRIVDEGHTLAMHSYSHKYSQIYESKEAFAEDLIKLQEYLYDTTGYWSRYYRFPGGSSNTTSKIDMNVLIDYLGELDIEYFDWNIASGDAVSYNLSADRIFDNCVAKLDEFHNAVILMHDAQARKSTVEALPRVIEYIQAMDDTVILPISDDTVPVQHRTANN